MYFLFKVKSEIIDEKVEEEENLAEMKKLKKRRIKTGTKRHKSVLKDNNDRFGCDECDKTLSDMSSLINHKRIHSGRNIWGIFADV